VGAPKNTPAPVIDALNSEFNAALADPGIRTRLAELGTTPIFYSPAEFRAFVEEETEKWAKVIEFSGATAN
jgi:tripartite-type tricarboxylate transporter receptor subunit TctC